MLRPRGKRKLLRQTVKKNEVNHGRSTDKVAFYAQPPTRTWPFLQKYFLLDFNALLPLNLTILVNLNDRIII